MQHTLPQVPCSSLTWGLALGSSVSAKVTVAVCAGLGAGVAWQRGGYHHRVSGAREQQGGRQHQHCQSDQAHAEDPGNMSA